MASSKDNVLFVRGGEVDNNDPWDDSVLIRAYNDALGQSNSTIADKPEIMETEPETTEIESALPKNWKKWDACRAVYSVDGRSYEAIIISIKKDKCHVKFRGYGNREAVPLSSLTPSLGTKAVREQIRAARLESTEKQLSHDEEASVYSDQTGSSSLASQHFPPPPPPPAPPMFPRNGEALGSNDAFHAMLMSWYMSGYHTGYYECLKRLDSKH